MRTTLLGTPVTLLSCAVALLTANARAQDAAPPAAAPVEAAPPPAEPAAPAPVVETPPPPPAPTPAPESPAEPAAQAASTEAAAPAEEETLPAAWIRFDSDIAGLQLWAGATHPLADGIGLATDIYLASSGGNTLGEFDIGPAFTAGPMTITPMLGFQVDWSTRRAAALVPQLYVTGGPDPIYMELWIQDYQYQVFKDGDNHDLYTRFFIDYKVSNFFALGPQVEPWFALNKKNGDGSERKSGLTNLALGGNVMLTNYGKGGTLLLFAGYELKKDARDAYPGAFAGRFTFLYNF